MEAKVVEQNEQAQISVCACSGYLYETSRLKEGVYSKLSGNTYNYSIYSDAYS